MRPDAHPLAQLEEPAPQLDRPVDGMVELERRLAGEGQAHDVTRDTGNVRAQVSEEAGWVAQTRAAQQGRRERPGDVDRGEGHRPVEHVDTEAPAVDPVAHPHLRIGRTARGEGEDESGLTLAEDHAVVHHVAALIQEQRVA